MTLLFVQTLGLMPGRGYEEKEIILGAGEAVLFYSDGLVEAHNPRGEMFGFPRLRALVAEHGEEKPLGDLLLEELRRGAGGRYHPPYASMLPSPKPNFLELLLGEGRRIHPLGRCVKNPSGEDVTEARGSFRMLPVHPATRHP
jgi:hypothetical protein